MKSSLLLTFLMFLSYLAIGQIGSDNLWSVWKNEKSPIVERLAALEKICKKQYLYSQPDSAYALSKIGYEFAEREDLKKEMSDALKIMGIASSVLSNYQEAISLHNRGIDIGKSIDDQLMVANHLKCLGNVYLKMSDYSNAIDIYSQGLEIAEKKADKTLISSLQNNIGLVYFDLKNYDKALEILTEALQLKEEIGDENKISNTLTNIGTIHRKKGNYEKAFEYYQRSLQLKLKNEITHGLPICYSNLGLIHQKRGEDKRALEYFKLSLDLQRESENRKGIARSLINFGMVYQKTNLDTAILILNEAIQIAKETNNKEEICDATKLLSQVYQTKGEYKKALEMHQAFSEQQDSILSLENQKAILAYEFKIKHEKEILKNQVKYEQKLGETQLRNQRNQFLLFGSIILLGVVVGFTINKRYQTILKRREDLLNKVASLKEKLTAQTVSSVSKRKELSLDKDKIERAIGNKIGESSWIILNLIFENPSISNKEIAEKVSLSVEGVSSSLRRMYTAFGVKAKGNKKVTLLMRAVNISVQD